jgi:hypothetical protein
MSIKPLPPSDFRLILIDELVQLSVIVKEINCCDTALFKLKNICYNEKNKHLSVGFTGG